MGRPQEQSSSEGSPGLWSHRFLQGWGEWRKGEEEREGEGEEEGMEGVIGRLRREASEAVKWVGQGELPALGWAAPVCKGGV